MDTLMANKLLVGGHGVPMGTLMASGDVMRC